MFERLSGEMLTASGLTLATLIHPHDSIYAAQLTKEPVKPVETMIGSTLAPEPISTARWNPSNLVIDVPSHLSIKANPSAIDQECSNVSPVLFPKEPDDFNAERLWGYNKGVFYSIFDDVYTIGRASIMVMEQWPKGIPLNASVLISLPEGSNPRGGEQIWGVSESNRRYANLALSTDKVASDVDLLVSSDPVKTRESYVLTENLSALAPGVNILLADDRLRDPVIPPNAAVLTKKGSLGPAMHPEISEWAKYVVVVDCVRKAK